jgi:hypothetical protein
MFIGVGPLDEFGYPEIRRFGYHALELSNSYDSHAARICLPIHGPGYGLDETEAFTSLLAGIIDAIREGSHPGSLESVEIVEINFKLADRFKRMLGELVPSMIREQATAATVQTTELLRPAVQQELRKFGEQSQKKIRLFVAMPFKAEFDDEWFMIQEAAHLNGMLCERVDKSAFVGDILAEVRRRIEQYDGLVALLNGANPNVFLELGYAWAKEKPTILLAKDGQELPFDVKGQRCLVYKGVVNLREQLKSDLGQLAAAGTFGYPR